MKNLLFEDFEYKTDETPRGTWRRFVYPSGELFEEFTSHTQIGTMPLVHYTRGRCPETGKRVVARGVIAVGRIACGVVAIGQLSFGVIAIGQLAIAAVFAFGQGALGALAVGQLAIGGVVAVGQIAIGSVAVGQIAIGRYVLGQIGLGKYVWDVRAVDPIARQFFQTFMR